MNQVGLTPIETTRFWKRLFGLKRGDRVRILGGVGDKYIGQTGTVSYVFEANHTLKYLVKIDITGSIVFKDEDLEWIPREQSS